MTTTTTTTTTSVGIVCARACPSRVRASAKASSSFASFVSSGERGRSVLAFKKQQRQKEKRRCRRRRLPKGTSDDDGEREGGGTSTSNDAAKNDASFGGEDSSKDGTKTNKKRLGSKGVNLFDPAATLSRALTKRFGIVGGLSLVAVLALVEGGEIVKSLLEIDKDVDEQSETVTESGLKIKDVRIGGGGMPKKGNFVGVEVMMSDAENPSIVYVDTKKTRKPIAFIYKSGKPLLTPLCEGIVEGVSTMKRGGIRELRIPSENLGFGANDVVLPDGTTKIPGGTDLFVRLELVDVTSYYQ